MVGGLENRLKFIFLHHCLLSLSARILAVGLFVQLGYHNCKILAKFYPWLIIIHLFGLQLKLLHNAYHILPTLHTIFQPRSSIIKEAKAVPHCFDMTNTIWQNQVPVIFLMEVTVR